MGLVQEIPTIAVLSKEWMAHQATQRISFHRLLCRRSIDLELDKRRLMLEMIVSLFKIGVDRDSSHGLWMWARAVHRLRQLTKLKLQHK